MALSVSFLDSRLLPLSVLVGLCLIVLTQFWLVRGQMHRQELEADGYAVTDLGASREALEIALRKISEWCGGGERPNLASTHPTLVQRLHSLKKAA
jgi:Zn-dependent protease with chaperone function